jgi:hypothetical protein
MYNDLSYKFAPAGLRVLSNSVKKENGCLIYLGSLQGNSGYGKVSDNNKSKAAHRAVYEYYHNLILSSDQHILHSCDNKLCVNIEHLSIGNQLINMQDKVAKSRQAKGETNGNCKLTNENVIFIFSSKLSYRTLQKMFDIGLSTIADIKKQRNWGWLTANLS